MKGVKFQFSYC